MIEKSYRFKIASGLATILFSTLVILGLNDLGCVKRQFNGAGEVTTLATFYLPQTGGVANNLSVNGLSMSSGIDMNGHTIENISQDFVNRMATLYRPCTNVTTETDITIEVESGIPIYNISVTGDSDISFDLSSIDITNNVARWETWIKVYAPGMTVGLPSTNAVQYLETPDLTTTTANELLQVSWQAWMDGTNLMMQGHLYGRVLGAHIPTLEELRLYHYGDPNIVESPASWFVFDAGTKAITGYNYGGGMDNVVIPWEIDGVAVEVLGDSAFLLAPEFGAPITNVVAGRSVLSIGERTFQNCRSLTAVTLPAATDIGYAAFNVCELLTSVTLPAATSIGGSAFNGCDSLTSVTLPAATSIGGFAFGSCNLLTSVTLPVATSIGGEAFFDCTLLSSVYFGNATPTEGQDMFNSVPGPVTIYYPDGAPAWSGVTTWGGMPTAPYTP